MKKPQIVLACLALLFVFIPFGRAQTIQASSTNFQAEVQELEQTEVTPASEVASGGTYYSAKLVNEAGPAGLVPYPTSLNLSSWNLGDNVWLIDDLSASSSAATRSGIHALDDSGPPSFSDTNDDGGNYYTNLLSLPPINTNLLWIQITNVANGLAYLNLNMATDAVYSILQTTNVLTPLTNWQVVAEVWPANETTNVLPFTVETDNSTNLFWQAEDWTGVEINGLPAWWTWLYFGNTDESATNLDSLGNTFLYDYQHHLDPNIIEFGASATNYYVNQSAVPVQIALIAGVPSYYAVLVNNTNEADAVWQDYPGTNLVVELGSTNGNYNVWIGLKGFATNATQTWDIGTLPLTLETVPPVLTVTNPTTSIVTQDMIQVQGYANEGLSSLTFDVSNAAGIFTNQTGFLTGQFYDTNLLAYTTNYFECDNVALNSGSNLVTLHATDWAGNTASVSRLLDYVPDTNPPTISLLWPQAGATISGGNFTVQAEVNEPAVTVAATVNGTTVPGLVEQGGMAWAQNLLLMAGTNMVTLTASNSFGGVSATNFSVIGNDVGLVINPLPGDELNQTSVSVTGSVGNINDAVTVNGVAAYFTDDNGDWEADGVPVNPAGTANLNVQVSDASGNPLTSQNTYQPQPPLVELMSYSGQINGGGQTIGEGWSQGVIDSRTENSVISWSYSAGGSYHEHDTTINSDPSVQPVQDYDESLSPATNGVGAITPPWENAQAGYNSSDSDGDTSSGNITITTHVMIQPSGQQVIGQTNVYLVEACASEVSDSSRGAGNFGSLIGGAPSWWYGTIPLSPDRLQIQGQTLVNTGLTNTDGSFWGATLISAPAGMNTDITPLSLDGVQDYTFYEQATNVTLQILDANNGNANLSSQTNTVIVGQQMNFTAQLSITNSFMTNFPLSNFQWTVPGYAISNYVANVNTGVLYTNFATNSTNVAFYWADNATNRIVQCSVTMNNGQTITGQATFDVVKPNVQIPVYTGTIAVDTNFDGGFFAFHYGDVAFRPNVAGILFTNLSVMPIGVSYNHGNTNFNVIWIQEVNSSIRQFQTNDASGTWYWLSSSYSLSNSVLDTDYPAPTLYTNSFIDAPNELLTNAPNSAWKAVIISDSFTTWLMFKPSGGGWVPLENISWNWSGTATLGTVPTNGNYWSLTAPTNSVSTNSDSFIYPTWNANIQDYTAMVLKSLH